MREILFRGKRLDNGEWVYGNLNYGTIEIESIKDSYFISDFNVTPWDKKFYPVISETVGQSTGLTDKNGTKVFEGDIVKTKFGRICKVIFFQSPCYCGIDLIPLEDKHKCPDKFDLYLSDNLEIIGNIHDNPELLEVTK